MADPFRRRVGWLGRKLWRRGSGTRWCRGERGFGRLCPGKEGKEGEMSGNEEAVKRAETEVYTYEVQPDR